METVTEQTTVAAKKSHRFCTFRVSGRQFGVNILDVKEVNLESSFTPIFHAPEGVCGYVNIRGQIYLILDLCTLLGLDPDEKTTSKRLVLFKPEVGESFGVLVDQIGDVVVVDDDAVEDRRGNAQALPESGERRGEREHLASGVCKLEGSLLVILNARKLLAQIEKTQDTQS